MKVRISKQNLIYELYGLRWFSTEEQKLLNSLPDFIELEAEVVGEEVEIQNAMKEQTTPSEGKCCEACRENPPSGDNHCTAKGCPCHS